MGIPYDFVLAFEIFLFWEDIRIVEQDHGLIAVLSHPFQDGGRAWSAARM